MESPTWHGEAKEPVTELATAREASPPPVSLTLWLASSNLAVCALAFILLVTAHGAHLSGDVPDGGVAFVWWVLAGSPVLVLATVAVAVLERGKGRASRRLRYAGLALAVPPLVLSVWVWVGMTR
jgi:hypothetical protein